MDIGKGALTVLIGMTLAGCGDVEWFPDPQTTTTPFPPTSSTTKRAVAPSNSAHSGKFVASCLAVCEEYRTSTLVTVSAKVNVSNGGTADSPVTVRISGQDSNGFELCSHSLRNSAVAVGATSNTAGSFPVDRSVYERVKKWVIKEVSAI